MKYILLFLLIFNTLYSECYKVKTNYLNVRISPDIQSEKIGFYKQDDHFCTLQIKEDWGFDGIGWINLNSDYVEYQKNLNFRDNKNLDLCYIVDVKTLNVRELNNVKSNIIDKLYLDEIICGQELKDQWLKIKNGWIFIENTTKKFEQQKSNKIKINNIIKQMKKEKLLENIYNNVFNKDLIPYYQQLIKIDNNIKWKKNLSILLGQYNYLIDFKNIFDLTDKNFNLYLENFVINFINHHNETNELKNYLYNINNQESFFLLGLIYEKKLNFIKAKEYYLKSNQLENNNFKYTYHLGRIYEITKDFNNAIKLYQHSIILTNNSHYKKMLENRINLLKNF